MTRVPVLLAALLIACSSIGQPIGSRGEYATQSNGLMYSEKDMGILRGIVDSLQLRFKTCDLSKPFYTLPQGWGVTAYFSSDTNDLQGVITAMKENVPPAELQTRFKTFFSSSNPVLFIETREKGNERPNYLSGNPNEGYRGLYWEVDCRKGENASGWLFRYSLRDKYTRQYSVTGYYFSQPLTSVRLQDEYARLVQYVDCMIDTNATVALPGAKYAGGWYYQKDTTGFDTSPLVEYILQSKKSPEKADRHLIYEDFKYADSALKDDPVFRNMLTKLIEECLLRKQADAILGELASSFGLYSQALQMKRSYRVMGSCSQDTRPRDHAFDIALLSARSHSWDIFLRAHLDIMNDRFERMVDGSYAYGDRKTYLKELEELNLDVVDLMLGLTLRARNVADNHYFGTVWRLGWALAESKEKQRFETTVLSMIADKKLDAFNRGLMFLLYSSYLSHLEKNETIIKWEQFLKEKNRFPEDIQVAIDRAQTQTSSKRK